MQNLVPHFILEKHASQGGEASGQLAAAALFIDISGFSTVTHSLSRHGSEAAEVMAGIMCSIFAPLVEAVYAQGGFITSFAGDGFTALFPLEADTGQHLLRALAAARQMQAHLAANPVQETAYGRFPFAIKLGLGQGRVDWGIVRPSDAARLEPAQAAHEALVAYYFSGPAVEAAAEAEHYAQPGNLVLAPDVAAELGAAVQTLPVGSQGHARLLNLAAETVLPPPLELPPPQALAGQERFVPAAILEHSASPGEFRQVVTVFINLMGVQSHADLEPFVQAVFALQAEYGGYLARLDFGDKGCNLLLLWGAPTGSEDDIERALNFTLALGEHTPGSYKAGLTFCHMYAGLAGTPRRGEWTCYGDGINLAARLMIAAPWGSLWLDERLARRAGGPFVTEKIGEYTFKGFDAPQSVYALLERQRPELANFFRGKLVGHAAEMAQLEAFVQPLLSAERRFAGILSVEGEAGLGKSRLVTEFLLRVTAPTLVGATRHTPSDTVIDQKGSPLQWALCQTDPTVRESFNPFRYWLRNYFEQSPAASAGRNKRAFGRVLDGLVAVTDDAQLQTELNRGRSFLGALVDLQWDNSPYAALDPQGRYELTLAALAALVRAESRRCPLIINLEDAQWLDEDSLACIARLTRTAAEAPFAILATARPRIGGQPLFGDLPYQRLELGLLVKPEMEELAQDVLGGAIDADLSALLDERAEGNPFFAEQILLFLREQGGLEQQDGGWRLAHSAAPGGATSLLPSDVRLIFTSRLDGLSNEVREVVQTAAILGREFEVRVLDEMLRCSDRLPCEMLPDCLQKAASSDIWSALTEIRYLFKHALLRDAAYEMQLRARRRELHRLAAGALEKVYAADLAAHYAEIAYHYQAACQQGLAAVRPQALDYLERAGKQAAQSYENAAALQAFGGALELLEAGESERRWALLLQREAVYALTGARPEQAGDLEALAALAEASQRPAERGEAALRRARYGLETSDYGLAIAQAQAAAGLAQAAGRVDLEAEAQQVWGEMLYRQGSNYLAAAEQAQRALALARSAGRAASEANILRLLGLITGEQHKPEAEYRQYFEQSLALSRAAGDRVTESKVLGDLGNLARSQVDLAAARGYFEQSLAICQETGDRIGEGRGLALLGTVAYNQGNMAAARDYYEQSLAIFRATGSRHREGTAITLLGETILGQGNFAAARTYFEQAQTIYQATGSQGGERLILLELATVSQSLGNFPAALEYIQQSLAIARAIDSPVGELAGLIYLADLRCCQGQADLAGELAGQALELARQFGNWQIEIDAHSILGQAALLQGAPATASEHFAVVQAEHEKMGGMAYQAEALAGLALAAVRLGDPAAARQALEQVTPILAENPALEGTWHPLQARLQIGQSWLALGEPCGMQVISEAYRHLQACAAMIPDEATRRAFLENVPENRELCALYAQLHGQAPVPAPAPERPALQALPEEAEMPPAAAPPQTEATEPLPTAAPDSAPPPADSPKPETLEQPSATPPAPGLDKTALAAQIAALLGQSAQAQGVTVIILGDIHIQQISVNGPPAAPKPRQADAP